MKFVCDTCAKPARGATAYHGRDGLVRVECLDCHARRLSRPILASVQVIGVALWLLLLGTQLPWILGRLSAR
ncbi:MAG TPA: hypothetical protein VK066_05290 [Chloroflexota bacterium]|nr:hypothetical protein [Chloroflexota bacterium]